MYGSDSQDLVIRAEGLRKRFGSVRALAGLDLAVDRGEIHGFLGPNGSGKSTTVRILLGMLRADGGLVRLFGADPWDDAVDLHRRLAYVPGDVTLWPGFTGGEAIDVLLSVRGAPGRRRESLMERFALDPSRRCRTYSKGNRQKVALVAALACDTDLLVLDEPTSGLDPLMEAVFVDCVREAAARGTTVLLSSHILAEVEALCDRVTIVRDGATVRTGPVAELRRIGRVRITARTTRPVDLDGIDVADLVRTRTTVRFDASQTDLPAALAAVTEAGVVDLTCAPPSLEEVFLDHYAGRSA
ncbi:MAG: ABC transporter ATP-binding protein [Micrococcales bacterium]|nr:ABC transporter ATP-binding protein [Micrococcales bacterium]